MICLFNNLKEIMLKISENLEISHGFRVQNVHQALQRLL